MVSLSSEFWWLFLVPSRFSGFSEILWLAAGVEDAGAPDFLQFLRENEGRQHSLLFNAAAATKW